MKLAIEEAARIADRSGIRSLAAELGYNAEGFHVDTSPFEDVKRDAIVISISWLAHEAYEAATCEDLRKSIELMRAAIATYERLSGVR